MQMIAKQAKVVTSACKAVITASRDKHEMKSLNRRAAIHLKHHLNNQIELSSQTKKFDI